MYLPTSGYTTTLHVRFGECDPMGHVNNVVYLSYFEQIAIDHADALGWSAENLVAYANALFVARRHEIDYFRPARERDWLQLRTWPTTMSGARGMRYYEIARLDAPPTDPADLTGHMISAEGLAPAPASALVARASTEWAFMNVTTGRPVRIPPAVADAFVRLADDPPAEQ